MNRNYSFYGRSHRCLRYLLSVNEIMLNVYCIRYHSSMSLLPMLLLIALIRASKNSEPIILIYLALFRGFVYLTNFLSLSWIYWELRGKPVLRYQKSGKWEIKTNNLMALCVDTLAAVDEWLQNAAIKIKLTRMTRTSRNWKWIFKKTIFKWIFKNFRPSLLHIS